METELARARPLPRALLRLPERLLLVTLLLIAEKLVIGLLVDYDTALAATPGVFAMRAYQRSAFHVALVLAAALALFVAARDGARWRERLFPGPESAVRWPLMAAHGLLFAAVLPLAAALYSDGPRWLPLALMAPLTAALVAGAALTALLAVGDWAQWRRLAAGLRGLWFYAGATALAGAALVQWSESLWPLAARATFFGVQDLLQPLLPSLQSYPERRMVVTGNFSVEITNACSGLEGAGLMLMFCGAWLLYFRSEYRFPRALLLIPAGLVLSLALNVVRIAVLVLIGHSGHPGVAIYGFHSQAGWIAFTGCAMGLAWFSRRSAWLRRDGGAVAADANPVAAYLLPFLAILAAGTLAHAASSGFEFLYPLRFIACGCMLWMYRSQLAALDWRCSWRGALAGVVVFAAWVGFARGTLAPAGMPAQLLRLPPGAVVAWIAVRAAAAIITVPIAEELAYRGFLMRRWQRAEFETLPFAQVRWPALALTAVVFGMSHGAMWPVGMLAGLVYGALALRTGRMGECVLAHATTNALLAAMVIGGGQWRYW